METITTTRITACEAKRQLAMGVPKRRVAELLTVTRVTLWRWLRDGTLDAMAEAEKREAQPDRRKGERRAKA